MIKLMNQIIRQSKIGSIIICMTLGILLDVVDIVVFKQPFNFRFILLTIASSFIIGIFWHELEKARDKLKEKEKPCN